MWDLFRDESQLALKRDRDNVEVFELTWLTLVV